MPGAPRQTWYCSVSLRWKRTPGGGVLTSGERTRRPALPRSSLATPPAPASCDEPLVLDVPRGGDHDVAGRVHRAVEVLRRSAWTHSRSRRPTRSPGDRARVTPKTASVTRSWTRSCGVSSYIAISSSTTSRSESRSAKAGAKTMSVITSTAVARCWSATRAYTTVCSRDVAAFSSPPSESKISAISCALYEREPLKSRCSMKCETPALASRSSRDPAPIQKPSADGAHAARGAPRPHVRRSRAPT